MTPEFLAQLRSHVSAEAYRQLPPDDLWARVRDHLDETAFRVLLERVGGRVYRRCRTVLGDPDLADEAFQDSFRDLVRKRSSIPTYPAAAAWVYQAAYNHARRLRRKQWRQVATGAIEGAVADGNPTGTVDAADAAERALAGLPDRYRRPIELVYWDGLTHAEAAVALGWTKGTVDSYVARGLKRMRGRAGRLGLTTVGATLTTALARPAAALGGGLVDRLVLSVWAGASSPPAPPVGAVGWKWAATVAAVGTAAGAGLWWAADRRPDPPPAPRPALVAPAETLQAKNFRILQAEVVQPLLDVFQRALPSDNPVAAAEVRTFGSEVELEIRPARPVPNYMPSRLRLRYCTFRRQLVAAEIDFRTGGWRTLNLPRLISTGVPNPLAPFTPIVVTTQGAADDRWDAVRKAFDRLPADDRAEAEQLRLLLGLSGRGLLLPVGCHVAGFPGGLIVQPNRHGLYVRDRAGRLRYAGECVGWGSVVVDGQVYCMGDAAIWSRPLDDSTVPWVRECDWPPVRGDEVLRYLVADRTHVVVGTGHSARVRTVGAAAEWTQVEWPPSADGAAAAGGQVYGAANGRLYVGRFAATGVPFRDVGPAAPECTVLVADGDRLLAYRPDRSGPVFERPFDASPDRPWTVVGRVHDPYKR